MIDLYKENHVRAYVRACVCAFVNFFFKKTSSQKLLTGLLPNFLLVFLRGQNLLFIVTEKSGLRSDTGAQAPLVEEPACGDVDIVVTRSFWCMCMRACLCAFIRASGHPDSSRPEQIFPYLCMDFEMIWYNYSP